MIADRRDLRQVIASSERDSAEKSLIADLRVIASSDPDFAKVPDR